MKSADGSTDFWRRDPRREFDSLRFRLMLVLSISLLPAAIYGIFLAQDAFRDNRDRARDLVRHYALVAANQERQLFEAAERELSLLSQQGVVRRKEADCGQTLSAVADRFPQYDTILVTNADGRVACAAQEGEVGLNVENEGWFQEAREAARVVSSPLTLNPLRSSFVIVLAEPMLSDLGTFEGAVAVLISVSWLKLQHLNSNAPADAEVFLIGGEGEIVTGQSATQALPTTQLPVPRDPENTAEDGFTLFEGVSRAGERRVFAQRALRAGEIYMVFSAPVSTAFDWVTTDLVSRLIAPLAMWLLALIAAMAGADRLVVQWLHRLEAVAGAYSRGRFSVRPKLANAPAELRELGEIFGEMADRLAERETELKRSLADKQVLLQEIHHRVKNNLQIVSSLLSLQSKSIPEGPAREALAEAHSRIGALALVHRGIYESEDLKTVNLKAFVTALCRQLQSANNVSPSRVRLTVDAPSIDVPAEKATPMAMLIAEAVTNAFKYAFPDGRRGAVRVVFELEEREARLIISDDGVGRDGAPKKREGSGSGIGGSLIDAFARQLGGELSEDGPPGLTLTLHMQGEWVRALPTDVYAKRASAQDEPADQPAEAEDPNPGAAAEA
ncbi:MAG: histidine kinase dimerization/phosphoacceptor domain -containing protein [Pseudomonadota bacterium]